jgi:hypothetical protein
MAYNYEISHEDSLIRVRVTGTVDEATIRELWASIVKACETYNCYDVLGVSNLDTPFSTTAAFSHHEIFSDVGVTHRHRIAWVDENGDSREVLMFTETVLVNRGKLNGGVFASVDEAEQWLRAES